MAALVLSRTRFRFADGLTTKVATEATICFHLGEELLDVRDELLGLLVRRFVLVALLAVDEVLLRRSPSSVSISSGVRPLEAVTWIDCS